MNDVAIFYSGDLDAEDYKKSISREKLSLQQLAKIEHLKNPTLCKTAEYVRYEKRAGYQENLLEQLLEDMNNS